MYGPWTTLVHNQWAHPGNASERSSHDHPFVYVPLHSYNVPKSPSVCFCIFIEKLCVPILIRSVRPSRYSVMRSLNVALRSYYVCIRSAYFFKDVDVKLDVPIRSTCEVVGCSYTCPLRSYTLRLPAYYVSI